MQFAKQNYNFKKNSITQLSATFDIKGNYNYFTYSFIFVIQSESQ